MFLFDSIYFRIIFFGVFLPVLFYYYTWKIHFRGIGIQGGSGLNVLFSESIKKYLYLTVCAVLVSLIALYFLHGDEISTGMVLVLNLTMVISAGLSFILIRDLLIYLYIRYPRIFENKFDLKKVDKVVQYGVNVGYAAVVGIVCVIVILFSRIPVF